MSNYVLELIGVWIASMGMVAGSVVFVYQRVQQATAEIRALHNEAMRGMRQSRDELSAVHLELTRALSSLAARTEVEQLREEARRLGENLRDEVQRHAERIARLESQRS